MQRTSIKITGESGMGLLSTGDIIIKTLKRLGFYANSDREFPSLIKGGHSSYQIDFSIEPIYSLNSQTDILIALDEPGISHYHTKIKDGGILIHGFERFNLMPQIRMALEKRNITILYLPARDIAYSFGGNVLMTNMILVGLLWHVLNLDYTTLEDEVKDRFASKPKLLEIDLKCLKSGHTAESIPEIPKFELKTNNEVPNTILVNGNTAIALGAIQCGVRAYYAYPMSPASSILSYMAKVYHETGIVVKQAEDEITAVQMTIGSMHTGARTLVATSGGGFDLMTESISLAAITETPLVLVIAQRPGPATGLPTWTCQGDLSMAIHAAHGEFVRIVVGCSDPESAYELIQHAYNYAEKYQVQVIFLTEKVIAESLIMSAPFEHAKIPIERGLVTDPDELANLTSDQRYKITDSGISKRWLPGSSPAGYFANGDEHWESGELAEDAERAQSMIEKRMRKNDAVIAALPEAIIYGPESGAEISFVGWGSSKNVMRDIIRASEKQGRKVNYLHYEYLWPFKPEAVIKFFENNPNVHLIECNFHGQFGQIIEDKTDKKFINKLLKFNGRAIFCDEVLTYIEENLKPHNE